MIPGRFTPPERLDDPALIMAETGEQRTFRELDERSSRVANLLAEAGLVPGDVVLLFLDNRPEVFEVYWGAVRSGMLVTAVSRHLKASEVAYIAHDSGARAVVVASTLADAASDLTASIGDIGVRLVVGGPLPGYESYEGALVRISGDHEPVVPQGMAMLYSSGTTGRPKGIRPRLLSTRPEESSDATVGLAQSLFGFGADTVYYSPAPLYHAAPLRFSAAAQALGGTVVVPGKFDARRALEHLRAFEATHAQFVPTMFVRMLKLEEEVRRQLTPSSLRLALLAAAPCPPEVKARMIEWWGPVVMEYYSATEGVGMTVVDSKEALDRPGTVGRPAHGVPHVCDEAGVELPIGATGTIYFEQPQTTFEYFNDPEGTLRATHRSHPSWMTVGDIGRLDEDGYLYLSDRKAFTINSGGVNIYPQEAENVLTVHPAVRDVAIIGVPDEDLGEKAWAYVELEHGISASQELAEELIVYTQTRIARVKCPRGIEFVAALPRTESGKLLKARLRSDVLASLTP